MIVDGKSVSKTIAQDYIIQDKEVHLPIRYRKAFSFVAIFSAPTDILKQLIPGNFFEIAEIFPGKGMIEVLFMRYIDNDLGNYDEIVIGTSVYEKGVARIPYVSAILDLIKGRLGHFGLYMPVTEGFACEAGKTIWGFPRSVENIKYTVEDSYARVSLSMGDAHVLTLAVPKGGRRKLPETLSTTYTVIKGIPHKTTTLISCEGVGFHRKGSELILGSHEISDMLRKLGLPKRPMMAAWMENMHGILNAPTTLKQ